MVLLLSGPVKPLEIIAQSVMTPVIIQTAMEDGSLSFKRPCSETKMSGDARAGLTNIPDCLNNRA
jgi:hypothetical protein